MTVFLATQMYLAALQAEGLQPIASLGLSLGEYSHLVDIGALDLEDALDLVNERGRCYDEAPAGVMGSGSRLIRLSAPDGLCSPFGGISWSSSSFCQSRSC